MLITIDLRDLAQIFPPLPIHNPADLKTAVCKNITYAVGQLARNSQFRYAIDPPTLLCVLDQYLTQNPEHNNPFNIVAKVLGEQWTVDYYNLTYGLSGGELSPQQGQFNYIPEAGKQGLVNGKITLPNGVTQEGKWKYVSELKQMCMVDGQVKWENGQTQKGKWQYIPELKKTCLVEGTTKWANGQTQEGKSQYIPELNQVHLVEGKITFPHGEIHEGKRKYISELLGVTMVDGKITFPNGEIQEGKRQCVAELRGAFLVEGTITHQNGSQRQGRWKYNPITRFMEFDEQLPATKLNAITVFSIKQTVAILGQIFKRYDTQKTQNTALSNLVSVTKQAIHAQTKPQFEQALTAYAQHIKSISRALTRFTHPDKVGPNNTDASHAFGHIMGLRNNITVKVESWLAQWPT